MDIRRFGATRWAAAAALVAFVLALIPQITVAGTADAARIRALKASLTALQKRYAQQEQRIERLENAMSRLTAVTTPAPAVHLATAQSHVTAVVSPLNVSTTNESVSNVLATPSPHLGGAAPKTESTKNIYQQENALFNRGLTLTPGVQYSYGDSRLFTLNGFLALGAIFLGNIDVTRQQNTLIEPSITADYSASPRTQLELTVPWVYRYSLYDAQGAQNSSQLTSQKAVSTAQFGDVAATVYYRVPQRRLNHELVLNGHLSVPTGTSPYGVKIIQDTTNTNLSFASRLPTGTGVYTASLGATIIQTADPAILFGGLNIYGNLMRHFSDISPSPIVVQPGSVAAGKAVSTTLGAAFALNDKVSTSFSLQDTIVQPTRLLPDGGTWQTVLGSGLNAAVFNIGTTISTSQKSYWQAVLGIGLTQDAPNYQFNMRFPQSR